MVVSKKWFEIASSDSVWISKCGDIREITPDLIRKIQNPEENNTNNNQITTTTTSNSSLPLLKKTFLWKKQFKELIAIHSTPGLDINRFNLGFSFRKTPNPTMNENASSSYRVIFVGAPISIGKICFDVFIQRRTFA